MAAVVGLLVLSACGPMYTWGRSASGGPSNATPTQVGDQQWKVVDAKLHYCAINVDEALYCWGFNSYGQVGDGTTEERDAPVRIGDERDWTDVSVGFLHTCGVRAGGLYCWGNSDRGQVGTGTTEEHHEPVRVGTEDDWVSVAVGAYSSCGFRDGDGLYCWGFNELGQLGLGDYDNRLAPTRVDGQYRVVDVGGFHTCAVTSAGNDLHCWGANNDGQLGVRQLRPRNASPQDIDLGPGEVSGVSAGTWHTCATVTDPGGDAGGDLYCWGNDDDGQLGVGDHPTETCTLPLEVACVPSPTRVGTDSDWTSVSAGGDHTCGIRTGGDLYCWGNNEGGQVGNGSFENVGVPTATAVPSGWTAISAGWGTNLGIREP